MSVKLTIMQQMGQGGREHGKILPPLREDLVLANCGLDSLGFAVLVARLEDTLGIDPFTAAEDAIFPITLGDFVKVYEHGRQGSGAAGLRSRGARPKVVVGSRQVRLPHRSSSRHHSWRRASIACRTLRPGRGRESA